jgi:hypothetical protein
VVKTLNVDLGLGPHAMRGLDDLAAVNPNASRINEFLGVGSRAG